MNLPVELTKHIAPSFGYIAHKARTYCKIGHERYRKGDFFNFPDIALPDGILAAIDSGMAQLCEYCGMTEEDPLKGLGIEGFYALMETLHFELEMQTLIGSTEETFLDKMDMKHKVTDLRVTVYNLVETNASSIIASGPTGTLDELCRSE